MEEQEREETRRGLYVLLVLAVIGLVAADRLWGLGLWVLVREVALRVR